jgi:hypothetical protein
MALFKMLQQKQLSLCKLNFGVITPLPKKEGAVRIQ